MMSFILLFSSNMKVLFLNLPADVLVVRRYMCSSFAESFLFPPHDLISLAGIANSFPAINVSFLDAVAERKDFNSTLSFIKKELPDIIVSIISFELYDKDVLIVKSIKENFPGTSIILFGHYPTQFPEETLNYSGADIVISGEPDLIFSKILGQLLSKKSLTEINGISFRKIGGELLIGKKDKRVPNPDLLPMPAYELLNNNLYSEPLMLKPFGLIQTARGCPYQCNYCVHSFGTKLTMLSAENILDHILRLKALHNIRSLRFIDDTFTVIPSRVIEICKKIIDNNLKIQWTCLARADTLDEEMLIWMKQAGCIRLNIGMESGSQKILDILNKGMSADKALRQLQTVKKTGLEMMGFFLTGVPGETDDDIKESIAFAKEAGFNYVAVDTLKVYPGTPLFEKFKDKIDFSLFPYRNNFLDENFNMKAIYYRKEFYRNFYFSMNYLLRAPAKNLMKIEHVGLLIDYVWRLTSHSSSRLIKHS